MPKVKAVVAMKQRLEQALTDLDEQETIIELLKQAIEKYSLLPGDLFSDEELDAAAPSLVDGSVPFCDADGNTWSGKGRRPLWLREALDAGAELEDFKNPRYQA